jgi:hypothetical protein
VNCTYAKENDVKNIPDCLALPDFEQFLQTFELHQVNGAISSPGYLHTMWRRLQKEMNVL